jgi:predicted short-subunit dehydrogenase-like oxidoreductase (DUF2520 family)
MKRFAVSFTGSGKVASALIPVLLKKGHRINLIVSRGKEKGEALARTCSARWSDTPVFDEKTDIVIVAVRDSQLPEVLNSIRCSANTVVCHTAGSYGLELFPPAIARKGVFYPLQTFSEGRPVDLNEVPVFTEASDRPSLEILNGLAVSLGCKPMEADTEKRRMLHIAAVFVSNFTNFMLTNGEFISSKAGFEPDVLRPLILETVNKALAEGPFRSQTGPAVRNDLNTVKKHLDLLSFSPELQVLYSELTSSITELYKKRNSDE